MNMIVFGDSITYGAGDERGGWVQRIREATEKKAAETGTEEPGIYNLGISGDTTDGLVGRLEDEIKRRLGEVETVVVFAIGINDSLFMKAENQNYVPIDATKKNIQEMIDITKNYTHKIYFIGLTPVDEKKVTPIPWDDNKFYRNEYIEKYDKEIITVAQKNNLPYLDLLKDFKTRNYEELLVDGLHPNTEGYKIMAELISGFLKENRVI